MTIDDILPSVGALSHAEKLHLAQIVLQQLAQEAPASAPPEPSPAEPFDPQRFYGTAHHSRQEVDQYLAAAREVNVASVGNSREMPYYNDLASPDSVGLRCANPTYGDLLRQLVA